MSISVMAHPSRKDWVDELISDIGKVPISWDDGIGIWENRKKATLMSEKKATHHLVLQDDAIVCDDFHKLAHAEIKKYPNFAHSFYFGRRNRSFPKHTWAEKFISKGGVKLSWLCWGVAVCLPKKHITKDMLEYGNIYKKISRHYGMG